jgi:hypothetical protein
VKNRPTILWKHEFSLTNKEHQILEIAFLQNVVTLTTGKTFSLLSQGASKKFKNLIELRLLLEVEVSNNVTVH